MPNIGRRNFVVCSASVLLAQAVPALARVLETTPPQPAGPFYPRQPPLDNDNDLAHVIGQDQPAQGQITDLTGHILDPNGRPLKDHRIEIWQCDANGRYRHPRDSGERPLDPGFQGFGHTVTDREGRYRFRTIRPMPYPGRTPHIHVAVFPPGDSPFVTQLYAADDARNAQDFLYARIPADRRGLVTTEFKQSTTSEVELVAEWDVVLGVTPS